MLREFTDAAGKRWRVWDVYPTGRAKSSGTAPDDSSSFGAFPHRELSDGWLCFECGNEKRRLAPIPPEWEICAPLALAEFCARAGYITQSRPEENENPT